jgi:Glyoxalase/Bleomycin resistance protein/Dioxygenase superfamily
MGALPFPNRDFMQVCWLVPDLRAAIDSWVGSALVGPFFWFDGVPFADGRHRGEPAEFPECTAAIAYAGDLQIELVCQENDDPGVFRDVFRRGEYGLHHMALICTDYETERDTYIDAGAALAFEGYAGTSRTSWVDTSPALGFMIELLEPSPGRDAMFAKMRDAAETWDGTNPIVFPS